MQGDLNLVFPAKRALSIAPNRTPRLAAPKVLRQIETAEQAVAVSMVGFKLAYIAASLEKSEAYVSRIRSGKRPVPAWMVDPFCRITGTMLLRQFLDLQEAMQEVAECRMQDRVNARLAEQLRA